MLSTMTRLVILYGIGGLSDIGRHAILAALEKPQVEHITVITEYPELLDETNWECGCEGGHTNPTKGEHASKITMVPIDSWFNPQSNLAEHFQGATAVISCLGHRQPGVKYPQLIQRGLVATAGNQQVVDAMKQANVKRIVVISSHGLGENIHWIGKVMKFFFWTNSRKAYKDLLGMEAIFAKSDNDLDYLLVRPTGLEESIVPVNEWYTQEKKDEEPVGLDLAKLDCARYMVQEALQPTRSRISMVVGNRPKSKRTETKA
jgi:nucleoside-diphosphate-sugar epimerase